MTGEDNPRLFVPPPLIFGGLLFLGPMIDRAPVAFGAAQIIAIIFALAGVGLIVTALGLFRSNQARPEPWQLSSNLVDHGIFCFTRNPICVGAAGSDVGRESGISFA